MSWKSSDYEINFYEEVDNLTYVKLICMFLLMKNN